MFPRSLLARNALLIAALVIGGQIISLGGFFLLVQLPRAAQLAEVTARYATTLEATLAATPRAELTRLLADPGYPVKRLAGPEPEGRRTEGGMRAPIVRRFELALAVRIDGRTVRIIDDDQATLWIALRVPDDNLWFTTVISPGLSENLTNWMLMSGIGALIGIAGAVLIQRRLNRPLDALDAAARRVGSGLPVAKLDEDGPRELAAVARSFNRMVRDIDAGERERALMLAGISHDVRTPLTRIRLASELLRGRAEDALVDRIEHNLTHVDRILGQFLAFARDEASETPVYADLNGLVRERIAAADAPGQPIIYEPGDVPEIPIRALALARAIDNLIANALRHGAPPVVVSTSFDATRWSVSVTDRGSGIPAAEQERLRQPFQRGEGDAASSTGLGLAIADRIARLHGGELRFSRTREQAFRVEIVAPLTDTTPTSPESG